MHYSKKIRLINDMIALLKEYDVTIEEANELFRTLVLRFMTQGL